MSDEMKYNLEEIKAIVDEEIRKAGLNTSKELNLDKMEKVSGGASITPKTHEEIDQKWDVIEHLLKYHGADAALFAAQDLDCLPGENGAWTGENPFRGYKNLSL